MRNLSSSSLVSAVRERRRGKRNLAKWVMRIVKNNKICVVCWAQFLYNPDAVTMTKILLRWWSLGGLEWRLNFFWKGAGHKIIIFNYRSGCCLVNDYEKLRYNRKTVPAPSLKAWSRKPFFLVSQNFHYHLVWKVDFFPSRVVSRLAGSRQ